MYPDAYLNYDDETTICFFSSPFEVFNDWSAHRVKIFGQEFQTAEAAFQYAKFHEVAPDIAEAIANAPSPWAVYQITDRNRDKTPSEWKAHKAGIMEQVIRAKVDQNEDVRQRLIDSGSRHIIENSPWDEYWGRGPRGDGLNMLGKIYMKVRAELQAKV